MTAQSDFGQVSLAVMILLASYSICGAFFEDKNFYILHETGLGILFGFIAGVIFYFVTSGGLYIFNFNQEFFFYILLPVIIYSGGYNLTKKRFFDNIKYIIIYGLLGTISTFIMVWYATWLVNDLGWIILWDGTQIKLSVYQMMIFSATISASDTLAALTSIQSDQYPKLFSVVFGEGVVNDAISIILFVASGSITSSMGEISELNLKTSLIFIGEFMKEFFGSIIVGALIGLFTTLCFKWMRFLSKSCVLETGVIVYIGYLSFSLCQLLKLSGVNSVLVTGIVLAKYNNYNLSSIGKLTSSVTLQSLSFLCESFIYIYLGIAFCTLTISGTSTSSISWQFVLAEIIICFITRFISIFLFSTLSIIIKGKNKWKLSLYEMSIIWFGGLVRGYIAYALIENIIVHEGQELNIQVVQSTVLLMVVATTIILGCIMPLYVKFHLKRDNPLITHKSQNVSLISQSNSFTNKKQTSWIRSILKKWDEQYFKPFFIFEYHQQKISIQDKLNILARSEYESRSANMTYIPQKSARPSVQPQKVRTLGQNSIQPRFGKQESVKVSQISRMFVPLLIKSKYQQQTIFFDLDTNNQQGDTPIGPVKVEDVPNVTEEEEEEEKMEISIPQVKNQQGSAVFYTKMD